MTELLKTFINDGTGSKNRERIRIEIRQNLFCGAKELIKFSSIYTVYYIIGYTNNQAVKNFNLYQNVLP